MGRVKFAVKEIKYTTKMEIDTQSENIVKPQEDEFEEYEDVESIMHHNAIDPATGHEDE